MPNDAKLGLIIGVGVVVTIAVVFFRKDAATSPPLAQEAAAASVRAPKTVPVSPANSLNRPIRAEPTVQSERGSQASGPADQHQVPDTGPKIPDLPEKRGAPTDDDDK